MEQTNLGLWFLLVWHGGISDSIWLLQLGCWSRLEPPLIVSFVLFVQSGAFLIFLAFCGPFFLDLFPCTSKVHLVLAVWGAALLGEGYPEWAPYEGSQYCGGSPLFPVLSFATVRHWVIGRPRNAAGGGLLRLPLCRSGGFLFWRLQ